MAIPKTQGRSDLETIRSISSALKNGDAVGLFPEGTRSWDGKMMNITEATAKLVRLFKVPTVFINIEGGFSKKPRWSHKERKGKVYLKVKRILMPDEIKASSISDLLGIVKENLTFDNTAWQKENGIEYFDKARQADGIERVMYQCRSCGSYETLSSYRDEVICSHCGKKYKINGYYDAVDESGSVSLASYHDWEKSKLRELVGSDGEILGHGTKGVLFQKGEKGRNVDLSRDFMIHAYPDRISFVFSDGRESSFPYSEIESMIICAKYTVEFYHKGQLYRFRAKGAKSTLKYQDYYSEYIEMNKES